MTDSDDIRALLKAGIVAAKTAQANHTGSRIRRLTPTDDIDPRQKARDLLQKVVSLDPLNIPAWLWLSTVVDDLDDKQVCLDNVLYLDPTNKPAQVGLVRLAEQAASGAAAPIVSRPTRPKPKLVSVPQEQCPFCQKPISTLATVCDYCQLPLTLDCPACKNRVDVEQAHCPNCGHTFGDYRDSPTYFANLAAAYQKHNQSNKAIEAWQRVAQLDPAYPHLQLRLGQLLGRDGRTEAAISALQQALSHPEDELSATLALGTIFQELRRWDEAEPFFGKLLAKAPNTPESQFALGWFKMERGKLREALAHLQKATKLEPQHSQAWLRLAQLYDHLGRRKEAAQAYQQATRYLSADTLDNLQANQRLGVLKPSLPKAIGTNWGELIRQMTGPIALCGLAALLDSGLRPWWIPATGWLAIFLAIIGTFLWVSGSSLPRNPLLQLLLGQAELTSPIARQTLAAIGLACWFLAFGLIVLPINQTFPELPTP
jgi:tetratricopeptide (TPR) repeat protein